MAEYLIQSKTLDDIADAIIDKTGTYGETMTPAEMVTAIAAIPSGGGGGSGTDISPFKFVKGTMTPSQNASDLTFPCGDITTVVFFEAKVVDYDNYISADNNGMGLGRVHYNFRPYFDNRAFNASSNGTVLSVYNDVFDFWSANNIPTVNATNQTATFAGRDDVTFKAGIQIEYVILGV